MSEGCAVDGSVASMVAAVSGVVAHGSEKGRDRCIGG
jgi:hypothetical protein